MVLIMTQGSWRKKCPGVDIYVNTHECSYEADRADDRTSGQECMLCFRWCMIFQHMAVIKMYLISTLLLIIGVLLVSGKNLI